MLCNYFRQSLIEQIIVKLSFRLDGQTKYIHIFIKVTLQKKCYENFCKNNCT